TPAYPKKLPIVLIATLAMLLLSSGLIVTGELLRMTTPRATAGLAAPVAAPRAKAEAAVEGGAVAAISAPAEMGGRLTCIRRLAQTLRSAGEAVNKVPTLGTATGESITLTALKLARLLARDAKVVVVDLAASSPTISAISADPSAAGLAELMQGDVS